MGRATNDRSISGHRHQIRPITDDETRLLIELRHKIVEAHAAADDFVVSLYEDHVSQRAIADVLGVTQGAVHQRVLRRREWLKRRRETGAEPRWFNPRALGPRSDGS